MSVIFRKKMEAGSGEEERGLRGVEGGGKLWYVMKTKQKETNIITQGKGKFQPLNLLIFIPSSHKMMISQQTMT